MAASTEFNVSSLEKELKNLWQQMAHANQYENQQPIIRASVLNLIVHDPQDANGNEVCQIMGEVTAQHPGRVIVLLPNTGEGLAGWVTMQCHVSGGGRKQVCCELIMLRAGKESLDRVPSIIRPLLVPDIPAILWWRDRLSFDDPYFHTMLETTDRTIIDSGTFTRPLSEFPKLAQLTSGENTGAITDLNWARLGPWRLSLVRLFDVPDYRSYLMRCNRVEIAGYDPNQNGPTGQSLLFVSWIASRLKWKLAGPPRNTGKSFEFELQTPDRPVQFRIHSDTPAEGGISRVRIVAESDPTADFTIFLSRDKAYLVTNSDVQRAHAGFYITRNMGAKESQLIGRELEILGHDWVYEQALQFCATLAK